jgi:hypothetical protein
MNADVDGTGLANLADGTKLKSLLVSNRDAFSDAGLEEIAKFTQLEQLDLSGQISDAQLHYFFGLKSLRELRLNPGAVTVDAIHELERALPGTAVIY